MGNTETSFLRLIVVAVFASTVPALAGTGAIQGTVVNSLNPTTLIQGALVEARWQADNTLKGSAVTDTGGSFLIANLAEGDYLVQASKPGYSSSPPFPNTVVASQTSTVPPQQLLPNDPNDTEPPTVPTGLTAITASPTSIQLNWNESTDNISVMGYKIIRDGIQITAATGTSYLDAAVDNGASACYTIRAFDTPGNTSDDSDQACATTPDTLPPSVPDNLTATTLDPNTVLLTWNPSTDNVGVTGYSIRRDGTVAEVVTESTYSDTNRLPDSTHYYTVTAKDAAGNESAQGNQAWAYPRKWGYDQVAPETQGWIATENAVDNDNSRSATAQGKNQVLAARMAYSHSDIGTIQKIEIGILHKANASDGNDGLKITPVYLSRGGVVGTPSAVFPSTLSEKTDWFDITADPLGPGAANWTWDDVSNIRADVTSVIVAKANVTAWFLNQIYLRVTLTWVGPPPPDNDSDHDGVNNETDQCPETPAGTFVDATGCPDVEKPTIPGNFQVYRYQDWAPKFYYGLPMVPGAVLFWDLSTDNVGPVRYEIYRGSVLYRVMSPGETAFDDRGLTQGATYSYYVRAVDGNGNKSDPTAVHTVTMVYEESIPPTVPTNLRGFGPSPTSLYLEWDPSTDNQEVTGYGFYVDGVNKGTSNPQPSTNTVWGGGQPDTCYSLTVSAKDIALNESAQSAPLRLCTQPGPPTIQITSPVTGATLGADVVTVSGTTGGGTSRVLVNSVAARLGQGTFTADGVGVETGGAPFDITAAAWNARGEVASHTVTVYANASGPPLLFEGFPADGAAPLLVTFTTAPGVVAAVDYAWDLDGDGVFEEQSATPTVQQELYETPGVYEARARVTDPAGTTYTEAVTVHVAESVAAVVEGEIVLSDPQGMAATEESWLYAARPSAGSVTLLDAAGSPVGGITDPPGFSPLDVAVRLTDNSIYVLDANGGQVHVYDAAGVYQRSFGAGLLVNPRGLAVELGGDVFVTADPDPATGGQIFKFDGSGALDEAFGTDGSGDGQLSAPKGIDVGDIGDLYVADTDNHRIVRFSTYGTFEENIGTGFLLSPSDVAWDETTAQVIVADAGNARVAVLKNGALTGSVGIADGLSAEPEHVRPAGPKAPGLVYAAEPLAGKIALVRLPTDLPDRVWAEMLTWLDAGNIDKAMEYFIEGQDFYRDLFRRAGDLHAFATQAAVITMKLCKEGYCEYEFTLSGQRDGQPVTSVHTIMFGKDGLGRWKIMQF